MAKSDVHLLHLPNEILLTIFNNLDAADILYSLVGVNKRLDKLVRQIEYTRDLELVVETSPGIGCSMADRILDRFCFSILPLIHHNIEELVVEPSSMTRILLAGEYPKLRSLILCQMDKEAVLNYFTGMSLL
jgi:hypothetical protein